MAILAGLLLAFSAVRSTTYFSCSGWFSCGDRFLPSFSDQIGIFEFLHHWSVTLIVVMTPLVFLLAILVFQRDDEAVFLGIRNAVLLLLIQAGASIVTSLVGAVWQAPALHFMVCAMLLGITLIVVAWAMFSPNQDYPAPLYQGALVVVSIIPLVPYIFNILR